MSAKLTPEQYLAGFPIEIRSLSQALRKLVKKVVPNVQESVYTGWRLIGYRADNEGRNVYFGYIAPSSQDVSLGFEYGILLRDPQQILKGDGSQVRYIRFRPEAKIENQIITPMIKEAVEVAVLSKEEKQDRFLQLEAEIAARSSSANDDSNLP